MINKDVFKSRQGLVSVTAAGTLMISTILFVLFNRKQQMNSYIIMITCKDRKAKEEAFLKLRSFAASCAVKTEKVSGAETEIKAEIRLKSTDTGFIHDIFAVEGVRTAALISCDREGIFGMRKRPVKIITGHTGWTDDPDFKESE